MNRKNIWIIMMAIGAVLFSFGGGLYISSLTSNNSGNNNEVDEQNEIDKSGQNLENKNEEKENNNEVEENDNKDNENKEIENNNIEGKNDDIEKPKEEKEDNNEEKTEFTVSFNSNGGSVVAKQVVNKNGKVVEPKNPTRQGYEFVDWYLNNKKYDFNTNVTSDIILVAQWNEILIEKTIKETEDIPYTTRTVDEVNMLTGTKQTVTEGVNGIKEIEYRVVYNSKNEEVSREKVKETVKKASVEKVEKVGISDFNLNENIKYYEDETYWGCCSMFQLKPACSNKTIGELMEIYPDYAKYLDVEISEGYRDPNENVSTLYYIDTYFPSCVSDVPNNILNELKKAKGRHFEVRYSSPGFSYIWFANEKSPEYLYNDIEKKYDIHTVCGCGDIPEGIDYNLILDEDACVKYNLSCGRW